MYGGIRITGRQRKAQGRKQGSTIEFSDCSFKGSRKQPPLSLSLSLSLSLFLHNRESSYCTQSLPSDATLPDLAGQQQQQPGSGSGVQGGARVKPGFFGDAL